MIPQSIVSTTVSLSSSLIANLKIKERINLLVELLVMVNDGRMQKMQFLHSVAKFRVVLADIVARVVGKQAWAGIGPCRHR